MTNARDFVLVGENTDGKPVTLATLRLARTEDEFLRRLERPRAFARDTGASLGEYLARALSHRAALTEPKDLAWLLASHARDGLARVKAAGSAPQLAAVRSALEEALADERQVGVERRPRERGRRQGRGVCRMARVRGKCDPSPLGPSATSTTSTPSFDTGETTSPTNDATPNYTARTSSVSKRWGIRFAGGRGRRFFRSTLVQNAGVSARGAGGCGTRQH